MIKNGGFNARRLGFHIPALEHNQPWTTKYDLEKVRGQGHMANALKSNRILACSDMGTKCDNDF